jgi:hypothetical protein
LLFVSPPTLSSVASNSGICTLVRKHAASPPPPPSVP